MKDRIVRLFFSALILLLISSLALAQPGPSRQVQSPVAVANQNGKEAVCEGALEIIPSGQMTFARKRYVPAPPKPKTKLAKPRSSSRR
jgi:hypothetical protein